MGSKQVRPEAATGGTRAGRGDDHLPSRRAIQVRVVGVSRLQPAIAGRVREESQAGIGLLLHRALRPDTEFYISADPGATVQQVGPAQRRRWHLLRCVRCEAGSHGIFLIEAQRVAVVEEVRSAAGTWITLDHLERIRAAILA